MTQDLEYSNVINTTPEDVWDEWFDDTHPVDIEDDDLPLYDSMRDEDTE